MTDVLVRCGDNDVLLSVASNSGANFSEGGFATLVERAERDESLAVRVSERPDIPRAVFCKLLMQASEVVQRRLVTLVAPELRAEVQHVLARIAQEINPETAVARNFTATQRLMFMLHQAGAFCESELCDLAKSKRYEETAAALSLLCAVPINIVDWLMSGDRIEPLLILFKAVGFDWLIARAVIVSRPSGRQISAKDLEDVCDDFKRLSYATARRVIGHWQGREAGLKAAV